MDGLIRTAKFKRFGGWPAGWARLKRGVALTEGRVHWGCAASGYGPSDGDGGDAKLGGGCGPSGSGPPGGGCAAAGSQRWKKSHQFVMGSGAVVSNGIAVVGVTAGSVFAHPLAQTPLCAARTLLWATDGGPGFWGPPSIKASAVIATTATNATV
jgi:hypothetical protein